MSEMELPTVTRLTRDMLKAAATLSDHEARFLVDAYYMIQKSRIGSGNQADSLERADEPNQLLTWLSEQYDTLETRVKSALDRYTAAHLMGSWMREIVGIGPVISAGMLAYIDMDRAPTVGHIWAFAGWGADNQKPWEKGKRRPYSTAFRTLCWKSGQSFMKLAARDDCYYGKVYRERKALEISRNESGALAEQAATNMQRVSKSTETYKHNAVGKLSPGHIDARARRYAVKLFLSHLHGEWHQRKFGRPAPSPYPIAFMGHAHLRVAPE